MEGEQLESNLPAQNPRRSQSQQQRQQANEWRHVQGTRWVRNPADGFFALLQDCKQENASICPNLILTKKSVGSKPKEASRRLNQSQGIGHEQFLHQAARVTADRKAMSADSEMAVVKAPTAMT